MTTILEISFSFIRTKICNLYKQCSNFVCFLLYGIQKSLSLINYYSSLITINNLLKEELLFRILVAQTLFFFLKILNIINQCLINNRYI